VPKIKLPKGQNREDNCRELAHDIAIYDIIVESLVWSRIGNIIAFLL
jgi:hypothetical protein